ncbi:Mu transposase C-terminal domain-containing protein [Tepidibacillus sp. HK-1]|uniref:Mu transposase C-terminal domain-containing protein n=1 Tax=Tepidibacillus sp. HK-1 TaxID=1883407 RepID=UPI0008533048|nr:Mu transposase C-terminal domain-containing protein [Tepidibacillus sp. HK-1]GBF12605.1 transposon Tn7 transposition protein TnsB [Tepidibacillus sp. HK-1]
MKLNENILFQFNSGKTIRVLYINPITSIIYVIDMNNNNWPFPLTKKEILNFYKNKEIVELEKDVYTRSIFEEELNEIEKNKRDFAWDVVMYLKNTLTEEEHMYITKFRQKAIKETMAFFNMSYNGVKNYLIKYFKGGGTKSSLIPNYIRCGAKGKERKVGEKKRGRPKKYSENVGVNIDRNIKKIFRVGLNRYYYSEKNNSLKTTFELILRDFFSAEIVDEKGVKIPLLKDSSQLPTYQQFLYWFKKLNNNKKEIIKRKGTRVYQQNYRGIVGSSTQDAGIGPGALFQIDSTILDSYLVSSFNRDKIVGRPILFLVVDVYSRVIVGFNISFESFNSYSGAMVALANSMTSKKEVGKKYDIEISDKEFPYCVPQRILADRGELVGGQIENAIEHLGITIQNSPPYHADYKGIIEQAFHQTNLKILPFADGVVVGGKSKKERGEGDYRLKATLTIDDFTKIIIKTILFHNNHHVLSDYILDETMIEMNVEKIPIKIWEHGLRYKKGYLRILQEEVIYSSLYPVDTATVTPKGVSFRKMLYASKFSLENSWFERARMNGSWRIKVSYNPLDMTEIFVFDENGEGPYKFSLLEHLSMYSNKGLEEIEQIKKYEKELEIKGKEKELQEKIKLYTEIEDIVKEARVKTEAEKDPSISKSKRIKGIKQNQRDERLLQRGKLKREKEFEETIKEQPYTDELDEFAMFRAWEESEDDE